MKNSCLVGFRLLRHGNHFYGLLVTPGEAEQGAWR